MIILCLVAAVADADTIRCANGERIRLSGIEARERAGWCHTPTCPPLAHPEAKRVADRILLNRRLSCRIVGKSYNRLVGDCTADGRSVSCALVRSGAAVVWERYWRSARMRPCD